MKHFTILLLLLFCLKAIGQNDSTRTSQNLFALTAEDIDRERSLVESRLNRKTTTASQIEQFASEAPATVYVITKEQIQNRGYESLLDVLDDIPEVEIQRYGSPEFNQHISLRGVAGNEKFLILQDGIRISAPTGDTHSVGYNFSVEHAEQVEVIIGPASAIYGADAFSGVIQIVTNGRAPNSIKTSYGRFGTTHNSLSWQAQIKELTLSINGSYYHSDEPNFPEYYDQDFRWYSDNYLPQGQLLISPFFQEPREVDYEGENRQFEMPTTSWYANFNLKYKDFEINYTRHSDSYSTCGSSLSEFCVYTEEAKFAYFIETIYGRHRIQSRDASWSLESIFSFHTYQLDEESAFINTYTSYEPGYKMEFGKSKKWREQFRYNFSPRLNLLAGVSYEVLDDLPLTGDLPKPFDFEQPADLQEQYYLGSNFTDKDGNDLRIQQDFFYLHYQNYGAYVQLQSDPLSNLSLTAGMRYDINTRYGDSFNPRLGVVWKPTQELSFKMLYGEALLSPSPRKSNSHFGSFFPIRDSLSQVVGLGSNFFHLSNSELEPENLRSLEASMRYVLSNNLIFSLNGYYTHIDNLINKFAQDPELTSFKGIDVAFIETGQNEGDASIFGTTARIDAVYSLNNGMGFNFYGTYSWSDGESNGEPLLFNARHHFNTGFELTHPWFTLSPRLIYRSSSRGSIRDGEGNFVESPGYALVNLFSRVYVVRKEDWKLSLFAKVDNLFDKRYYNVFIGGAEGFSNVPQRPMQWRIGAKLDL